MIIESLVDFFCRFFGSILTSISANFSIPSSMVGKLAEISGFIVWIVSPSLLGTMLACFTFWTVAKITVGIVSWIWDKIPLT